MRVDGARPRETPRSGWRGCGQRGRCPQAGGGGWRGRRAGYEARRVENGVLVEQAGVATRAQLRAAGLSDGAIQERLASGRWRRLFPRTFATFTGPVSREARLWAAVLYAGAGAALSHESAAELSGLVDEPSDPIHVTVPSDRRVRAQPGLAVHRSPRVPEARHPGRVPPQTRIEETVVDLVQCSRSPDRALDWVTRACARRLTTPERLRAVLDRRPWLRWRAELRGVLGDMAGGCHSELERRYLRMVEWTHGLPAGHRQAPGRRGAGRRYDDVRYEEFGLVVELDGRAAHPEERRWRDLDRDNGCVEAGLRVLRYGW